MSNIIEELYLCMELSNNNVINPYSEENLRILEKKLGLSVKNKGLLKTAISSRGAKYENPELIKEDNERLEFFGDSVLKFLISEHLFKSKSNPEGKMTLMRIEIENNETLGTIAKELNIKPHLFLSMSEKKAKGKGENSLLANALEAIIGAIYLDEENINTVRTFMEKKILDELLQILLLKDISNPITPLQEISQKRYGKLPRYEYSLISGSAHNPLYKADVLINNEKIAEAEGWSKKQAKKKAAKKALILLTN